MKVCLSVYVALAAFAVWAVSDNLALGRPYTFSQPPNYALCSDAGDRVQLTDGETVKGYFWTQKGTVGWSMGTPAGLRQVTVDLRTDQPIAGFSWDLAAGRAGVQWPVRINVYVSVDGAQWHFVGDLYARSCAEHGAPPAKDYARYRAWSRAMPCHGRHVAFLVEEAGYCFCDELEVYRGEADLLKHPLPRPAYASPIAHFGVTRARTILQADADAVARAGGTISAGLRARIDALNLDPTRPLIEPLCEEQREIFAANVSVLRASGFTQPVFRASDRWANVDPLAPPKGDVEPDPVIAMRRETRATAVVLVNPLDRACAFDLALEGFPSGAHPELHEVLFTRTKDARRIAGALRPGDGNRLSVEVPAGTSRQIWISFSRPDLPAGSYTGTLVARAAGMKPVTTRVRLQLADCVFPERPRLHVGGWDYSESGNGYYRSPSNLTAKIARMREMHVDTPWATMRVAPKGAKFGVSGELLNEADLDFTEWTAWTALWGDMARQYAVFVAGQPSFHGEKMGTPRFRRMVKEYFAAWYRHAERHELAGRNGRDARCPSEDRRFVLLPYDEPAHAKADKVAVAWCEALKAADARFVIFEDPTHADPATADPALYAASDVLCPNLRAFRDGKQAAFFKEQQAKGKELWLYACSGPSRTFDPLTYYRTQGWYAARLGAKGSFFWALGCGGGIGDSWHAFAQTGTEYSPFFVSPTDAMASKQSEAVRESAQDYEYLALLAEEIDRRRAKGEDVSRLSRLLAEAPVRALGETGVDDYALPLSESFDWDAEGPRPAMDAVRREILAVFGLADRP